MENQDTPYLTTNIHVRPDTEISVDTVTTDFQTYAVIQVGPELRCVHLFIPDAATAERVADAFLAAAQKLERTEAGAA